MIYKVKFNDTEAAFETFKKLKQNYLPHEKAVAGLYQLYLMSSGKEKEGYKSSILNDYPNSEYAKLIKDPNYKEKENQLKNNAEKEYARLFNSYKSKNYSEVIKECNKVLKDTTNPLICKYKYLKANALGELYNGSDSIYLIEDALSDIVENCKSTPFYAPSKATLDKLRNISSINDAKEGKSTYIYAPDIQHYFVLILPNGKGNSNKIKMSVSNFNKNSFSAKNLKTSSSFLDLDNQLVLVKSFSNKKEAMDYYIAFKVNKKELKSINKELTYFVISAKNYASFFIEKNIDEYLSFFEKNYN